MTEMSYIKCSGNKLCGLWWGRHNMPLPPASGDLNSHPELSGWKS